MSSTSSKQVILLTGASRGLGLAILQLLVHGTSTFPSCRVVTISRSKTQPLLALESEFPNDLLVIQADVTSNQIHQTAVDQAIQRWGRLDAIILNAGVVTPQRIEHLNTESFLEQLHVNTVSLVPTIQAALPYLKKAQPNGRVVFVSSGAAVGNTGGWAAYNASKAAMNSLARTLANEEPQLACFAIRPGVIDTDMQVLIRSKGPSSMLNQELQKFITLHDQGKLLCPEQPGYTIAALAVSGTRSYPTCSDGKGIGESGGFVNWDAPELERFQAPPPPPTTV